MTIAMALNTVKISLITRMDGHRSRGLDIITSDQVAFSVHCWCFSPWRKITRFSIFLIVAKWKESIFVVAMFVLREIGFIKQHPGLCISSKFYQACTSDWCLQKLPGYHDQSELWTAFGGGREQPPLTVNFELQLGKPV
ncbi:Histone H3.3 [Olea europaea subsp. europaea]|uniref:Histone H3.3 n=1 Tax=Olea europaea subsp. europaea TaxID=158383 RepID=A0A8S0UDM1_OLEEU|nr:Histone H3.3 [Olea europaea subsp. europaea]